MSEFFRMTDSPVSPSFNDLQKLNQSLHIIITIAILDFTAGQSLPQLYELQLDGLDQEENFRALKASLEFTRHEAFILVGEVDSIDKTKKHMVLTNGNTVGYSYLVTMSGQRSSSTQQEIISGLSTLLDALRLEKEVQTRFNSFNRDSSSLKVPQASANFTETLNSPTPSGIEITPHASGSLSHSNDTIYQVQI